MDAKKVFFRPLGIALLLSLTFGALYNFMYETSREWMVNSGYIKTPININNPLRYRIVNGEVATEKMELIEEKGRRTNQTHFFSLDGEEIIPRSPWREFVPSRLDYDSETGQTIYSNRILYFSVSDENIEHWYFITDGKREGHGFFVGYLGRGEKLGYIGLKGICSEIPCEEEQFPVNSQRLPAQIDYRRPCSLFSDSPRGRPGKSLNKKISMISGENVYGIDFESKAVTKIFHGPKLISLGDQVASLDDDNRKAYDGTVALMVRSQDQVVLVDVEGKERERYTIPPDWRDKELSFGLLAEGKAVLMHSGDTGGIIIDREGTVLREFGASRSFYFRGNRNYGLSYSMLLPLLTHLPSPVTRLIQSGVYQYSTASVTAICLEPRIWLLTLFSSVAACITYYRQKQYALPWAWGWAVFVFLAGLPGLGGYWFHRRWAVRLPCPACGKKTPRDRERCACCGAEFSRPERKGTEIFA